MSLKSDLAMVSSQSYTFIYLSANRFSLLLTLDCNIVFIQIIQKVYVAKEWLNKVRNDAKSKVYLRLETEKALGAVKEENKDLLSKLTTEERERKSAQA